MEDPECICSHPSNIIPYISTPERDEMGDDMREDMGDDMGPCAAPLGVISSHINPYLLGLLVLV